VFSITWLHWLHESHGYIGCMKCTTPRGQLVASCEGMRARTMWLRGHTAKVSNVALVHGDLLHVIQPSLCEKSGDVSAFILV
jgi:hypothetical protein